MKVDGADDLRRPTRARPESAASHTSRSGSTTRRCAPASTAHNAPGPDSGPTPARGYPTQDQPRPVLVRPRCAFPVEPRQELAQRRRHRHGLTLRPLPVTAHHRAQALDQDAQRQVRRAATALRPPRRTGEQVVEDQRQDRTFQTARGRPPRCRPDRPSAAAVHPPRPEALQGRPATEPPRRSTAARNGSPRSGAPTHCDRRPANPCPWPAPT